MPEVSTSNPAPWPLNHSLDERVKDANQWADWYIEHYPDEGGSTVIWYKGFQSELDRIADSEQALALRTIRKVTAGGWDVVPLDAEMNCTPYGGLAACFTVQLSPACAAVVRRDGRRMLLLTFIEDYSSPENSMPPPQISSEEWMDIVRVVTPHFVAELSSIPFYKAWGTEPSAWQHYIGSRIVAAKEIADRIRGPFVPAGDGPKGRATPH